ncbi:prepro-urotensin II-beta-like [Acipenser oxyrinchus oxyrinchus]|uniref:Prepro-urotensin II-beta-like n=1 Tax=Acipenser oxyrinchus oxyrinchus TaxID=40147 RepID=A0AAD8CZD1_ACIOX|nr:prepro-urotensin II-beta-like [Acipenser oxyrinchus oxyrinchus]
MMCKLLLSCFILLSLSWNLLSHPITDSSEMAYSVQGSTEEGRDVNSEALSPADKSYLSQSLPALLAYPSLLAEEISRDGLWTGGYMPSGAVKEVLMEKQSQLPHVTRILGNRNQYRKRGSTSECFWKYCV